MAKLAGEYVGSRVRITADEGVYDGILKSIDLNKKRLTLEKASSVKTGKKIPGQYNFFQYEIHNVQILEDNRKKMSAKNAADPMLVVRKQAVPHLDRLRNVDRHGMLLAEKCKAEEKKEPTFPAQKSNLTGPPLIKYDSLEEVLAKVPPETLAQQDHPNHYIFIDALNKVYREAILHIQNESLIGLAAEGVRMGRFGQISLIQVSTRTHVFVFDVFKLGGSLFEDGLGRILEYPKIQKVMHDSRYVSDALFHQFGIKLINVFDTQVAEVMLYRNLHGNDLPRYVQSYSALLIQYLQYDTDHAFFYRQREEAVLVDQKIWLSRPVSKAALEVSVRHVMHLPQLRLTLLKKMLQDFTDGVDIYLGLVRDAPEDKLYVYQKQAQLLPQEFRDMTVEADRYRRIYENRYKEPYKGVPNMVDDNGLRENCIGPLDTKVIYSSDSMWHMGTGKGYQKSLGRTLQECHRVGRHVQNYNGAPGTDQYIESEEEKDNHVMDEEDDCLLNLGLEEAEKVSKMKRRVEEMEKRRETERETTKDSFMTVKSRPAGHSNTHDILYHDIRIKELGVEESDTIYLDKGEGKLQPKQHVPQPKHEQQPKPQPKRVGRGLNIPKTISRSVHAHGLDSGPDSDLSLGSDSEGNKMLGVLPASQPRVYSPRGLGRSMLFSMLKQGSPNRESSSPSRESSSPNLQSSSPNLQSPSTNKQSSSSDSGNNSALDERFSDSADDQTGVLQSNQQASSRGRVVDTESSEVKLPTPPPVYPGLGRGNIMGRGLLMRK